MKSQKISKPIRRIFNHDFYESGFIVTEHGVVGVIVHLEGEFEGTHLSFSWAGRLYKHFDPRPLKDHGLTKVAGKFVKEVMTDSFPELLDRIQELTRS